MLVLIIHLSHLNNNFAILHVFKPHGYFVFLLWNCRFLLFCCYFESFCIYYRWLFWICCLSFFVLYYFIPLSKTLSFAEIKLSLDEKHDDTSETFKMTNQTDILVQVVFQETFYFCRITAAWILLLCLYWCGWSRTWSWEAVALQPCSFLFVTVPLLTAAGGCTWLLDRLLWLLAWRQSPPSHPFLPPFAPTLHPAERKHKRFPFSRSDLTL